MRKINRYNAYIEENILEDLKSFNSENALILLTKINSLTVKYDSSIIRGILSYCNIRVDRKKVKLSYEGEIVVSNKEIGTQVFTSTHSTLRKYLMKAKVLNFNASNLINYLTDKRVIG